MSRSRARAYDAEAAGCASTTDIGDFFDAHEDVSAYRAALAGRLFAQAARKPGPLPFLLTCQIMPRPVGAGCSSITGVRGVAARLYVANISRVMKTSCRHPSTVRKAGKYVLCYIIDTKTPGESFEIEVTDSFERANLVAINYSKGIIVYKACQLILRAG